MVEHIEEIGAELKSCTLSDRKVLPEAEVDIDEAVPPERVPAQVADSLGRSDSGLRDFRKRVGIEVLQG